MHKKLSSAVFYYLLAFSFSMFAMNPPQHYEVIRTIPEHSSIMIKNNMLAIATNTQLELVSLDTQKTIFEKKLDDKDIFHSLALSDMHFSYKKKNETTSSITDHLLMLEKMLLIREIFTCHASLDVYNHALAFIKTITLRSQKAVLQQELFTIKICNEDCSASIMGLV